MNPGRTLHKSTAAALSGLALVFLAPASADIKVFNAAVQSGDYKAATAEAASSWPAIDRAAPDAATIAREFGWVAMLAGQPDTALVYAKFLVEKGAALAHPDLTPAVSRVLFEWANLEAAAPSPQTRMRLYTALNERARAVGRDLISARAAQVLYTEAWSAGDFALSTNAATLAIRFLDELGAGSAPSRFELRRGLATSNFMRDKSPDAYNATYDVAAELYDAISSAPEGQRERLGLEYFRATAWGDAMYGALGAKQKSTADRSATIANGKRAMAELLYPAPGDPALPRCRIVLAKGFKQPGFPFVSRFKDFGGVVTYALDVQPNGAFANPRLLAVAPHQGFADEVDEVISTWRWRIDGSVSPPNCRMPTTHILTFQFSLGR